MKNIVSKIKHIIATLNGKCQKLAAQMEAKRVRAQTVLANNEGDFVMDHAMVFVIILAVAAVVIGALVVFVQTDMGPAITNKIKSFLN